MSEHEHMSHEEYVKLQRVRAALIASRVLGGELTILQGARLICELDALELPEDDQDLEALRLVDSESDHLPVGEERKYWAQEALDRKAEEIAETERWAREVGLTAIMNLARRFHAV